MLLINDVRRLRIEEFLQLQVSAHTSSAPPRQLLAAPLSPHYLEVQILVSDDLQQRQQCRATAPALLAT